MKHSLRFKNIKMFTLSLSFFLFILFLFGNIRALTSPSSKNSNMLSYRFDEHWGIEGSVDTINPTDLSSDSNKDKNKINTDENTPGFLYTINGIYHFDPFSLFQPYVLAGVGVSGPLANTLNGMQSNQINAGIGTQLLVSDNISLHGEFRDIYDTTGGDKNDYHINLGISFLLGNNNPILKN